MKVVVPMGKPWNNGCNSERQETKEELCDFKRLPLRIERNISWKVHVTRNIKFKIK